jgi:hypothetical protein
MDRALRVAVRRAGAPGGVRFTARQLYHELCRVLLPLGGLPRRPRFTVPAPASYERFLAALRRHGPLASLVEGTPAAGRPLADEPDLFDYGLPRLLVCQDRAIAAMLRANDLHLEAACPVYALDDLPPHPDLVAALRRGDATVFVLHDASAAGLAMATAVPAALDLRVVPLGLRPAHAAALHLTAGQGPSVPDLAPAAGLAPWEHRWLRSGRYSEVAAVNPARLLRTLHRLVRGQRRMRPGVPRLRQVQAVGFMSWPSS